MTVLLFISSCNDEWEKEQYQSYVSFKAPINERGVTRINVRYKSEGLVTYQLPLIVSGTKTNDKDMTVHVAVDSDTLRTLNLERFQSRTDLYYQELGTSFFTMPETVNIKSGENTSLINIDFSLKNIDLSEKWVLPLTIVDDQSSIGSSSASTYGNSPFCVIFCWFFKSAVLDKNVLLVN